MFYLEADDSNGRQLVKFSDVQRFVIRKLLKLDQTNNLVVSWTSSSNFPNINIYASTYSSNFYSMPSTRVAFSSSTSTSNTYSNLPPGYYILELNLANYA